MAKLITIVAASLVFISLVYAATVTRNGDVEPLSAQCLTQADVLAHLERSRQGISLTCNEQIRQRNLAR